ncbi:hypothetical protein ZWY2020_029333 [Hordeum vulgare]|nr:hypothetical protein ZWY2020_029333 [Hordeum vulgare]
MMSTSWRDKQDRHLINFIGAFLAANSYRLNFLSISPVSASSCPANHKLQIVTVVCLEKKSDQAGVFQDFIFNNGGLSVAFIFETNWDCGNGAAVFSRVNALKRQYKNLYVFVAVPTVEQTKSYGMELGCPTFVSIAVQDIYRSSTGLSVLSSTLCNQFSTPILIQCDRNGCRTFSEYYIGLTTKIPALGEGQRWSRAEAWVV